MLIGTVINSIWATRKNEKLNGITFMVVAIDQSQQEIITLVAADIVGAGKGDKVIITTGSSARLAVTQGRQDETVPVDAAIVAILDAVD